MNITRQSKGNSLQRGFTMIEILVVFSLVAVISGVGFASFNEYSKRQTIDQSVSNVKQAFEKARYNAVSQVKPTECSDTDTLEGYSVQFNDDAWGNNDGISNEVQVVAECGTKQVVVDSFLLSSKARVYNAGNCAGTMFTTRDHATFGPLPCTIGIVDDSYKGKELEVQQSGVISVNQETIEFDPEADTQVGQQTTDPTPTLFVSSPTPTGSSGTSRLPNGSNCSSHSQCSSNNCQTVVEPYICVECISDGSCAANEHCTAGYETPNWTCKLDNSPTPNMTVTPYLTNTPTPTPNSSGTYTMTFYIFEDTDNNNGYNTGDQLYTGHRGLPVFWTNANYSDISLTASQVILYGVQGDTYGKNFQIDVPEGTEFKYCNINPDSSYYTVINSNTASEPIPLSLNCN